MSATHFRLSGHTVRAYGCDMRVSSIDARRVARRSMRAWTGRHLRTAPCPWTLFAPSDAPKIQPVVLLSPLFLMAERGSGCGPVASTHASSPCSVSGSHDPPCRCVCRTAAAAPQRYFCIQSAVIGRPAGQRRPSVGHGCRRRRAVNCAQMARRAPLGV